MRFQSDSGVAEEGREEAELGQRCIHPSSAANSRERIQTVEYKAKERCQPNSTPSELPLCALSPRSCSLSLPLPAHPAPHASLPQMTSHSFHFPLPPSLSLPTFSRSLRRSHIALSVYPCTLAVQNPKIATKLWQRNLVPAALASLDTLPTI